ncbi:MAG: flippase [Caldilineaceae bacterium]|nr:flippase [Caldilineaceae bacterium]
MSNIGRAIAKNTSILMIAQLVMWAISLIWLVVLARLVGPEGTGQIQLANSLWLIVAVFMAFGSDTVLMKEIARNPDKTDELLGSALALRLGLYVIGFVSVIGAIQFFDYQENTINIIYLVGLASLGWLFSGTTKAVLQGFEKMETFSVANIVGNILFTGGSTILLFFGWGLYAVATMIIISAFANFAIQVYFLQRIHRLRFTATPSSILRLMKEGAPYLLSGLSLVAYGQVDVLVISSLLNEHAIGWYSIANRLTGTFMFIPSVYISATLPMFSRMALTDPGNLRRLISRSFDSLLIIGVPIGCGLIVLAEPIILLVFGQEFTNSTPILRILGIMLIITYQNNLIGCFLIAIDRQNIWTAVTAIAMAATLPLDLLVIPWCEAQWGNGAIGGAITFVITEFCMLAAGLYLLPSGTLTTKNLWSAARVLFAGTMMIMVVSMFQTMFIAVPILIGMGTYGGLILLFRVISNEDWNLIRSFVQQVRNKLRGQRLEAVS